MDSVPPWMDSLYTLCARARWRSSSSLPFATNLFTIRCAIRGARIKTAWRNLCELQYK